MFHRLRFPVCVVLIGIGLFLDPFALRSQDDGHRARKYKAPPPAAHIEVTVLKDFNGKPIGNAHVIFHPTEGDKDKGSLEVKTNDDGKAIIDVIPIGDTVTLQVIVKGYQTYGQSYKIDKSELAMEVRMKRPGGQYSTYSGADVNATSGKGRDSGASNASPPAPGNKSSNSGNDSKSDQSQPQPK